MFKKIVAVDTNGIQTICIYDFIGKIDSEDKSIGISGRDVADYIFWLDDQPEVKRINVRINSSGGIIDDGLSIIGAIRNTKKPVYTFVDGIAGSMAFIIFLAGKKRYIVSYGRLMAHYGRFDNPDFVPSENEKLGLDSYNRIIEDIVSMVSPNRIRDILKKDVDVWIDSQMALEYGLATEIIDKNISEDKKIEIAETVAQISNRTNYKVAQISCVKLHNIFKTEIENEIKNEMDIKEILDKIDSKIESIFAKKEKLIAQTADVDALKTAEKELENQKAQAENLAKLYAEMEEKLAKNEAEKAQAEKAQADAVLENQSSEVVDLAIKDNKIIAELKPQYVAMGKITGLDVLKATIEKLPVVNVNRIAFSSYSSLKSFTEEKKAELLKNK